MFGELLSTPLNGAKIQESTEKPAIERAFFVSVCLCAAFTPGVPRGA